MKFIMLFSLILPIFYLNGEKICINCKHFAKEFFNSNTFGKCKLFPREIINFDYLVDGSNNPQVEYYCSTARMSDDMCGVKGRFFEKKKV